jgi:hypothetical protein
MRRFSLIIVLGSLAIPQFLLAAAKPGQQANPQPASAVENLPSGLRPLPPLPKGKSTVIGGAIRHVDPVRDQLTLKVYGGKPMKILFDERTQLFFNGKRTPLRDLRPEAHAAVETMLDGTDVFARSIHILSKAPEGEARGQVLTYNSSTGDLNLSTVLSNQPIRLRVPAGTPVVRQGQAGSTAASGLADLVKGTLVAVKFQSGNNGQGVASHIEILATPGSQFVFSGNITFLDLPAHTLALVDPHDGKNYRISFDPARFPNSAELRQGQNVKVTTEFDGTRYVANAIKIK